MQPFEYKPASTVAEALEAFAEAPAGAAYLAGGTTIYDLMKLDIEAPTTVIDVHALDELHYVDAADPRELRIGAGTPMATVAADPAVAAGYPALAESLDLAASQQLRNMATVGGNLLQRTRCPYFRGEDPLPCNKRRPGSGCGAIDGNDRANAVLGTSDACIATYAGDWAVALIAFDARVEVAGPQGERSLPLADLHVEPGDDPTREHTLAPGEMIVGIRVPASAASRGSTYLKIRDRESYAFALASVAAAVSIGDGDVIAEARLGLGGVATRPWRASAAEEVMVGSSPTDEVLRAAGEAAFADARAGSDNGFKIELGIRTIADAVSIAFARAGG